MPDIANTVWLDEEQTCTLDSLAELSGLSLAEVQELADFGLIPPVETPGAPAGYRLRYVRIVSSARRLRDDFELDNRGLALALTLLRRIDELEGELTHVSARYRYGSP